MERIALDCVPACLDDDSSGLVLLQVTAKVSGSTPWTNLFVLDVQQRLQHLVGRSDSAFLGESLVFVALVAALLLIDGMLLQPRLRQGSWSNAAILAFWVCAGLAYNLYFFFRFGAAAAADWCIGYILEWMLSIDNLFVFHIIFRFYKMPPALMKKALSWGIAGAVVFRLLTFFTIGSVLHLVHWFCKVIGIGLIYSAYQAIREDDEDYEISQTYAVRALRSLLGDRLVEKFDDQEEADPHGEVEGRLLVWDSAGRTRVTLTAFVILLLEVTDVLFAIDSVSAKLGQIHSFYVAYSSSILAVFGLRAMFFVISDLIEYFEMLKYGICVILIFLGVEMMLDPWVHLRSSTVCFVVVAVFVGSIVASVLGKAAMPASESMPAEEGKVQESSKQRGWTPTQVPEEVAGALHSDATTELGSNARSAPHHGRDEDVG